MNNNSNNQKDARQEFEAKVTALLLDELPAEEAAALRQRIAQDPNLAKVHDRLKVTIQLVKQTVASPEERAEAQPASLKLSEARREKLLAHFKTIKPKQFEGVQKRPRRSWLVPIAAAAAIVILLIPLAIPNFVSARRTAMGSSIVNNLRQLDGAKEQWALENHKSANDVATLDDLKPYMRGEPPSLAGETYVVGKVSDPVQAELSASKAKKLLGRMPAAPAPAGAAGQRVRLSVDGELSYAGQDVGHGFGSGSVVMTLSGARPPGQFEITAGGSDRAGGLSQPAMSSVIQSSTPARTPIVLPAGGERHTSELALNDSKVSLGAFPSGAAQDAFLPAPVSAEKPPGNPGFGAQSISSAGAQNVEVAQNDSRFYRLPQSTSTSQVTSGNSTFSLQPATAPAQPGVSGGQGFFIAGGGGGGGIGGGAPVAVPPPPASANPAPAAAAPTTIVLPAAVPEVATAATTPSEVLTAEPKVEIKTKFADVSQAHSKQLDFNWKVGDELAKNEPAAQAGVTENEKLAEQAAPQTTVNGTSTLSGPQTKVPLLADMPAQGSLFRSEDKDLQNRDGGKSTLAVQDGGVLTWSGVTSGVSIVTNYNAFNLTTPGPAAGTLLTSSIEPATGLPFDLEPSAAKQPATPATSATLVSDGRLLYEMGKPVEAQKKLQEALKSDPNNQEARYYLNLSGKAKSEVALNKQDLASRRSSGDLETFAKRTEEPAKSSPALMAGATNPVHQSMTDKIAPGMIDFRAVDINQALALYGELANRKVARSASLPSGFLTFKQDKPLTREGARQALEQELAKNGVAIIDVGQNEVKAVPLAEANQTGAQAKNQDVAPARNASPPPIPQPEILARENAFSTFSLNVSDVSFKLAQASLEKGVLPEVATVRSEEFINAFDYRDPEPGPGAPMGFAWERARYPFAQNRDLLRFSVKTAAQGRQAGQPLNLVLLVDSSGSMERADRVRIIREALRVLLGQLQAQDTFSVVTFARTARLFADGVPGNQAGKVSEDVSGLTPEGGTNLEDAMNLAYQTALRHYQANGINRVVLLTDGAANLGNVEPESLKQKAEANRKQGIALDCFGIGWDGYNDDLLEVLSRNGGGRYGFINTPEEAASGFAAQLAGALQVAAADVKVQVEFNPKRVTSYRQIGYAKHQLTKEQFRDNTVAAAQIGAAESGNALYVVEINPTGDGPLGTVHVRYRMPGTSDYREQEWTVSYTGTAVPFDQASPAMRLAGTASAFSEWLAASPYATEVTPDRLLGYLSDVPKVYGADTRPKTLEWMIRQAQSLAGSQNPGATTQKAPAKSAKSDH